MRLGNWLDCGAGQALWQAPIINDEGKTATSIACIAVGAA